VEDCGSSFLLNVCAKIFILIKFTVFFKCCFV
jgi:hypothetical protein